MKIVAILDVNDKFFDEEKNHPLDEVVDKFDGYYKRPTESGEAVVVTKDDFFITF